MKASRLIMPPGPPIVTITPLDKASQPIEASAVQAQFNPGSLAITHEAKNDTKPPIKKDKSGTNVVGTLNQRTGFSTTLSSIELIFDTTRDGTDVRSFTLKLANMIYRADIPNIAPTVRFQWGTLLFKGTIDSMTETLDYFSELGVPLRATVSLKMSMTPDKPATNSASNGVSGEAGASAGFSAGFSAGVSASAGISASASASASFSASASASANFSASAAVGTTGLTLAQSGESLQSMSARAGLDWKAVAEANGIDNPRFLQAGAVVNLNASAEAKVTFD
jgi:hypothetical protein